MASWDNCTVFYLCWDEKQRAFPVACMILPALVLFSEPWERRKRPSSFSSWDRTADIWEHVVQIVIMRPWQKWQAKCVSNSAFVRLGFNTNSTWEEMRRYYHFLANVSSAPCACGYRKLTAYSSLILLDYLQQLHTCSLDRVEHLQTHSHITNLNVLMIILLYQQRVGMAMIGLNSFSFSYFSYFSFSYFFGTTGHLTSTAKCPIQHFTTHFM